MYILEYNDKLEIISFGEVVIARFFLRSTCVESEVEESKPCVS